jgi:hypothetical protein
LGAKLPDWVSKLVVSFGRELFLLGFEPNLVVSFARETLVLSLEALLVVSFIWGHKLLR